ncbi:MAG: PKD-like domain-containing protein, partial [Bacteroidota bacterium]
PAINNKPLTVCSGDPFTFTPANGTDGIVPSGSTYTWTAPTGTGFTGGSAQTTAQSSIGQTLTNTTNAPVTATYNVTATSGTAPNTCTNTFTVTVTVNPKPAINNKPLTVCSGNAFSFTPANITDGIVPAATAYTWSAPSGSGFTGGSSGSGSVINGTLTNTTASDVSGVYTITPTSGTCPGDAFTLTVTLSKPSINIKTYTICSGETFTYSPIDGTDGNVLAGTTYTWSAPTAAGLTGLAAGSSATNISGSLTNATNAPINVTYSITPISGACTGNPFTVTVTVNPKPAINNKPLTVCSGDPFTFTPANGTDGTVPSGTVYTWSAPTAAGLTGLAAGSSATNISGSLTNATNAPINV